MPNITNLFKLDGKPPRSPLPLSPKRSPRPARHDILTDILEAGGRALFMRHDVTDEAKWRRGVAEAVRHASGLGLLVNNAGIETAALLTEYELSVECAQMTPG